MKLTIERARELMQRNDGSLYLRGTQITSLPDNLTVGGSLYLSGTQITSGQRRKVKRLKDGDYVDRRYIYCDGILTHIERKRQVKGYTFYIGKIKGEHVVTDGEFYAHCKSLREGIADIAFKRAADRGADQFKGLSLDTEMTVEEAKAMYRIITGACKAGTEAFVESLGELKEKYSIREMLEITKGQYNASRFAEFFGCE